ncbi:MAG: helix-turn-helix domain-containing protein, partial [Thermoplasmata archaeon]
HLPPPLTDSERRELLRAVSHVEQLWRAPTTAHSQRKELVRLLISGIDVRVDKEVGQVSYAMRWVTGQVSLGHVKMLRQGERWARIADDDLTIIRKMSADYTDTEIAIVLGQRHRRSSDGGRWSAQRVKATRLAHGWEKSSAGGERLSLRLAARELHLGEDTLRELLSNGDIKGTQVYRGTKWRITREELERWRRKETGKPRTHQRELVERAK